jgi:hypothetical protein
MNKDNGTIAALSCIGALAFLPLFAVVSWLLNGVVLVQLWEWFVRPVFETAPAITVWQSVGLAAVVGFLTDKLAYAQAIKDPEKTKTPWIVAYAITNPLWALALGWVLQYFFL